VGTGEEQTGPPSSHQKKEGAELDDPTESGGESKNLQGDGKKKSPRRIINKPEKEREKSDHAMKIEAVRSTHKSANGEKKIISRRTFALYNPTALALGSKKGGGEQRSAGAAYANPFGRGERTKTAIAGRRVFSGERGPGGSVTPSFKEPTHKNLKEERGEERGEVNEGRKTDSSHMGQRPQGREGSGASRYDCAEFQGRKKRENTAPQRNGVKKKRRGSI